MRQRYIQHPQTLELVRAEDYVRHSDVNAPMVMPDIAPYQSMIDGKMITSRSKHREHLRNNGCVEVGNETKYLQSQPIKPPPGLKERIIQEFNQRGY